MTPAVSWPVARVDCRRKGANPDMDPDRWRRVAHLYELALERAPAERGAFLATVCADDDELRREIESLITHDDVPVLIDRPMLDAAAAVLEDPREVSTRNGTRTGASGAVGGRR